MSAVLPPPGVDLVELGERTRLALAEIYGDVEITTAYGGVTSTGSTGGRVLRRDYSRAGALALVSLGFPDALVLCPLHATTNPSRRDCTGVPAREIVARLATCTGEPPGDLTGADS